MVAPVRLLPLGGLSEIGMNCMVVDTGTARFLIDCGVTFDSGAYGARLIHADFSPLRAEGPPLEAVVLTHGHEDHLGAVAYLLQEWSVPVFGPPYAIAMLRDRLPEFNLLKPPDLRAFEPGEAIAIAGIEIESYEVTHSTADSTGLILKTDVGTLVHSGDFKIDTKPPGRSKFSRERLEKLGKEGVRLLLSDSTNVYGEGHTRSETDVVEALTDRVQNATGRVVVGQFASNVYRLGAVVAIGRAMGRKVCVLGRSARTHLRLGIQQGMIEAPVGTLIEPDEVASLARDRVLLVASGTQGERGSALWRLSTNEFREISLDAGDTVIFSSRTIPGNDPAVHRIIDAFVRQGMIVHHRAVDPEIHASGHARRGEQTQLIELLRPESFLPVHGTLDHLVRHAELAESLGVKDTLVAENGATIEVTEDSLKIADQISLERVYRTSSGARVAPELLYDRKRLGHTGHVTVVLSLKGSYVDDVQIVARGVADDDFDWAAGEKAVRRAAGRARKKEGDSMIDGVERAIRQYCSRVLRLKPLIDVVEVDVR